MDRASITEPGPLAAAGPPPWAGRPNRGHTGAASPLTRCRIPLHSSPHRTPPTPVPLPRCILPFLAHLSIGASRARMFKKSSISSGTVPSSIMSPEKLPSRSSMPMWDVFSLFTSP